MKSLDYMAYDIRKDIVDIVIAGKGGHIGGDMSMVEILISLYFNQMNISPENADDGERDMFILSKGHSVEALYAVLAKKGFFELKDVLESFNKFGSQFIGHPNNKINGIEMNSGSLGHGLPVAVGMALAIKADSKNSRVYVVMGDGELAEGSVWEGVMAASHYHLDNICAVVDRNRLQISGDTEDVMGHDDLAARFESFGWNVINVENGNSVSQLDKAFMAASAAKNKPTVLIANTIKGFGSELMENKANWHHKVPNNEEYNAIIADLKKRKEALANE